MAVLFPALFVPNVPGWARPQRLRALLLKRARVFRGAQRVSRPTNKRKPSITHLWLPPEHRASGSNTLLGLCHPPSPYSEGMILENPQGNKTAMPKPQSQYQPDARECVCVVVVVCVCYFLSDLSYLCKAECASELPIPTAPISPHNGLQNSRHSLPPLTTCTH
jgi:hypothetical protein